MTAVLPLGFRVEYVDAEEREPYRIVALHGLLHSVTGPPFDTNDATSYWGRYDRRGIYVMDQYGNVYASVRAEVGRFHHSSFLAGAPVAGADKLEVSHARLLFLSDHSGHYMPDPEFLEQVVERLTRDGIDLSSVEIRHWWERDEPNGASAVRRGG